jgi:multidrug transporter EmrE-like cation transporter
VTPARDSGLWLRLMLIAFLANGIGPFGLKILSERGLASTYQAQYLLYWYLGACVFAFAALWRSGLRPYGREVGLGALMGACSLLGQAFTGLALSHGLPGHVAFPITTGGSLFLVAAAGLLLFKEKIGAYGMAGMVLGIMALVGLSIG